VSEAQIDDKFDSRIREIISQMTLQEKVKQLSTAADNSVPRLNLPNYRWHNECLHGLVSSDITVFPAPIGLASTFDKELMNKIAVAISDEARIQFKQGKIGLTFWSPNLDLARDPRWGRTGETYGEDPYLVGIMGETFIAGIQGNDSVYLKAITSPKHYTIHSGPETERHWINPKTAQIDFWDTYMKPFEMAVIEGKSYSMMTAYNAYLGVPISVSKFLVDEVLRQKWGLRGYVMTDCGALSNVVWSHWYAKSEVEAVAMSLRVGVDLDCGDYFLRNAPTALQQGLITIDEIDRAVYNLLKTRFRLGLIAKPANFPYDNIPDSLLASYQHRMLAKKAAHESMVLLKNEGNILPLSKDVKSIFLIGPNAYTYGEMLGPYHGWPRYWVSVYDGLKNKVGETCKIDYEKGCEIVGSLTELISSKYLKTEDGKTGLLGEYFNNKNLQGTPALTRIDTTINFNWQRISPITGSTDGEPFSVRWTGYLKVPQTQEYTFMTINNDGTRLYINEKKILDNWWDHGASPFIGFDSLEAGKEYKIVLEYYFNQSFASVRLEWGNKNTGDSFIDSLVRRAEKTDVIIFVGGISNLYESEEMGDYYVPGFYGGDRTSINLPTTQTRILKALKKTGKPIVLALMSGSCLAINWENENIPAIVHTWYAGQETGDALADVLFGDYNPAGRTPITWYKSLDDVPDFKNYYMTNSTYRYYKGTPLYPFGYGLSYTKFKYSDLELPQSTVNSCNQDSINISFYLENTGNYKGDEVVQIYIQNNNSKFDFTNKSLKAFKRIHLNKSEKKKVTIKLLLKDLFIYDSTQHKSRLETGNYQIMVSASSEDVRLSGNIFITECSTDTNLNKDHQTSLYPNPTNNILYLHVDEPLLDNKVSIKVFDITGKQMPVLVSQDYSDNTFKIDCSKLTTGIYFVRFLSGTIYFTSKFVFTK